MWLFRLPVAAVLCTFVACFSLWGPRVALGADNAEDASLMKEEWCKTDNCYELLSVEQSADFREIKTSYNNISLKLHPDKNPNATEEEKLLYVKVNRAYEILSNPKKRADYDRYLQIRSAWDAPRENPVFVALLIYAGVTFIIWQYQKQHYRNVRKCILENPQVQQYVDRKFGIDLSGKKTTKRKQKGRKRKQEEPQISTSLLTDVDPMENNPQNQVTDEQISQTIRALHLLVPEWNAENPQPDWKDALWVAPTWTLDTAKRVAFFLKCKYKYDYLKQDMSDEDKEQMCRNQLGISEDAWEALSAAKQSQYLSSPGPWNGKKPKPERSTRSKSGSPERQTRGRLRQRQRRARS